MDGIEAVVTSEQAFPKPSRSGSVLRIFGRVKLTVALNHLKNLKRYLLIHLVVGVAVLFFFLFGGLFGFSILFNYLLGPDATPFGEPMLKRLVGMVLLAFFSMLTFSNLIIMLTTTYISREVEFYMAQPISHVRLFLCKFIESTFYSSWAFIVLSLPFFLALGGTKVYHKGWWPQLSLPHSAWLFYPLTGFLLVPYIVIPAALGAIIALLITGFFPAKRMFRLAFALAAATAILAVLTGRHAGISLRFRAADRGSIGRVMSFMGLGDIGWMPSTWLARAIRGALDENWTEVLFWGALLVSTALMAMQVCFWLVNPLYYRGFISARSSGTSFRKRSGGLYAFFDRLLKPIPSAIRSLAVKDLTVFWRDPAHWGQLVVLFGLLFLYVANLGSASEISKIQVNLPIFQSFVTLFNIGATCFVLAILSTRFIYPMLSLEGKQQWVIGLAPLGRTRIVWVKYFLYWACSILLSMPLILLSSHILNTDLFVSIFSIATIILMSMGLCSLAIGLGALMPNFQEDNPARIANGLGGTINVIVSLIYIALTITLEIPFLSAHINHVLPPDLAGKAIFFASIFAIAFLQITTIVMPMNLGLKHWRALEF